jgi:hypothetical protein
MAALFQDERYADLSLYCRDKEFRVHKAIVCSQCPAFDRECTRLARLSVVSIPLISKARNGDVIVDEN